MGRNWPLVIRLLRPSVSPTLVLALIASKRLDPPCTRPCEHHELLALARVSDAPPPLPLQVIHHALRYALAQEMMRRMLSPCRECTVAMILSMSMSKLIIALVIGFCHRCDQSWLLVIRRLDAGYGAIVPNRRLAIQSASCSSCGYRHTTRPAACAAMFRLFLLQVIKRLMHILDKRHLCSSLAGQQGPKASAPSARSQGH